MKGHVIFSLQLAGLPADAILEVRLPVASVGIGLDELLDSIFPLDEEGLTLVQESFDLEENPDLPEIYQSFLMVVEQSRAGLCRIALSEQLGAPTWEGGSQATLSGRDSSDGSGRVSLLLIPVYDALEYAAEQGYDAGESELLEWLQLCVTLFFLDKHEARLPMPGSAKDDDVLQRVVERLLDLGLAIPSEEEGSIAITAEARYFIGRLLAETESYIDQFDLFNDVLWDDESGQALFGTGHGDDLRVEAFIAEAVDPVRAVFLLRLYDGTLDEYVEGWESLVSSRDFYNRILEPLVDRTIAPADLLDEIINQGFSVLDDARQLDAERDSNVRIARQVGTARQAFPPP